MDYDYYNASFQEGTKEYEVLDMYDNVSRLRQLLTSFSLSRVEHSKKYSVPDFSFAFYWSLEYLSYDFILKYRNTYDFTGSHEEETFTEYGSYKTQSYGVENAPEEQMSLKYSAIAFLNNIGPVFHSPIGAFHLYLNLGLGYESLKIGSLYHDRMVQEFVGVQMGWNEFLTQNLFIFLNVRNLWLIKDKVGD